MLFVTNCMCHLAARMRFMSNALPPPGQYQSRSVLESMALDIEWATSAPDALMYRLCSTDISTTHSPEVSAVFMGMRRTLECLARNHPLIFSPTSIQQFITFMTYNASLADSLCSICSRDSSPEKHTWETIFQVRPPLWMKTASKVRSGQILVLNPKLVSRTVDDSDAVSECAPASTAAFDRAFTRDDGLQRHRQAYAWAPFAQGPAGHHTCMLATAG